VFYRTPYLTSYQRVNLMDADAYAYLVLRDEDGGTRAALPVTRQTAMDPLRVLARHEPEIACDSVGLLSHVWHCYDTRVPMRGDAGTADLAAILDAQRRLAKDLDAPWYGLVNVDATGDLARRLGELGARGVPIEERFLLDLPPGFDMDDYLALLTRRHRYSMRNQLRRAADAGASVAVLAPREADLDEHLRLVRLIGAKHGVESLYPPGTFQHFQLGLGDDACTIEVRVGGRLVGVGIFLLDETRVHFWTAGVDYAAADTFSPFYVLYHEGIQLALRRGAARFECGRRNGVFKRRYGMRSVPVYAYVASTSRPLAQSDQAVAITASEPPEDPSDG
jgi:CelD/BcsL family acetyltransferase involved in cellulose biosynthesis